MSAEDDQRKLPCQQKHDSPQYRPWTQKLFVKVPHHGVGKMDTGYRFKYFDLSMVRPVGARKRSEVIGCTVS